ncbi:hypothetical protein R6Q59_018293 [Mikania micrantha]|uniref:Uncharacterized protein n=1 Tax=Mikania micrantha TaxID=192012 RepID=A0A5N6M1C7_9ASTR|nr:hypothetical protein E3N88_35575 [Mikania micrantha]
MDLKIIVQSLLDLMGEESNMTMAFSPSIDWAPSTLRNISPDSFTPRVVSIGPLHRSDWNLKRFEGRKAMYVQSLLCYLKPSKEEEILTACVQKVVSLIGKIRRCYADIDAYNDDELAKMMVMDACFILEFIRLELDDSGYDKLSNIYIPYDLVLLENQIPFFVLDVIFGLTISIKADQSLGEFMLPLMKCLNLIQGGKSKSSTSRSLLINSADHILGYLHNLYMPERSINSKYPSSTVHSAVELDSAGVKFMPNGFVTWPLSMEVKMHKCSCIFWFLGKPTLRMPVLRINHFTELILRNLIVYEHLSGGHSYITSYAKAMDMLIDTHEDVAKLVRSKVIINHLGSNEEAASMINTLCKEVRWKYFVYGETWVILDNHFNGYFTKNFVNLGRTYFNSPWNIIALFAGIFLFVLAVLQTIFTIKSSKN